MLLAPGVPTESQPVVESFFGTGSHICLRTRVAFRFVTGILESSPPTRPNPLDVDRGSDATFGEPNSAAVLETSQASALPEGPQAKAQRLSEGNTASHQVRKSLIECPLLHLPILASEQPVAYRLLARKPLNRLAGAVSRV